MPDELNDNEVKILSGVSIDKFAGVSTPAQQGATVQLTKNEKEEYNKKKFKKSANHKTELKKNLGGVGTSIVDQHMHIIDLDLYNNGLRLYVSYEMQPGDTYSHSHSIYEKDGMVYLTPGGEDGHTHDVNTEEINAMLDKHKISKSLLKSLNKDVTMTDTVNTETTEVQKSAETSPEVTELKKTQEEQAVIIKRLQTEKGLTEVQKSYFDNIEGEEAKNAFLEKSAEDMDAEIKKSEADSAVDPEILELKKTVEEQGKLIKSLQEEKETAEILKKAEEYGGAPASLVKAIEGQSEADKTASLEFLKSQNILSEGAFSKIVKGADSSDPNVVSIAKTADANYEILEKAAEKVALAKSIDFDTAYMEVKADPQYAEVVKAAYAE